MLIEGNRSVVSSYVPAVSQTAAAEVESAPVSVSAGTQLPYISPVLQYDSDAAMAVLLFRDGDSGSVETQYPSKRVVREYQLRGREGELLASSPQALAADVPSVVSSGTSASTPQVAAPVSPVASVSSAPVSGGGGGLAVNVVA
jgi:beta-galactosidase GanA